MERRLDVDRLLHELRNPFAVIFTTSSLIGELPDDTRLSDLRRHLGLIQNAVEEGRALLDSATERLQVDRQRGADDSQDEDGE